MGAIELGKVTVCAMWKCKSKPYYKWNGSPGRGEFEYFVIYNFEGNVQECSWSLFFRWWCKGSLPRNHSLLQPNAWPLLHKVTTNKKSSRSSFLPVTKDCFPQRSLSYFLKWLEKWFLISFGTWQIETIFLGVHHRLHAKFCYLFMYFGNYIFAIFT